MRHNRQVRRRRVFYIPGYDPNPPRRYRELYRKEGAEQAHISGYALELLVPESGVGHGWRVDACIEGQRVRTDFEVLVWSDLVRHSMKSGIGATYWQLFRTAWIYLSTGALRRLTWLRKGPVIAALYPIAMLLVQLLVALLLASAAGALVSHFTVPGAGWVVALPIVVVALRWFRRHDRRLFAYYLMHDYAFTAWLRGRNPPELEERIEEFCARIEAALQEDVDEVLIVGHSSGVHLGVHIMARLARAGKDSGRGVKHGPELGFLSLGNVVPMVSFLPEAGRLRADLHDLAGDARITWVDVSAPGDGCSFALCDPVSVSGVDPPEKRWPLVISAAFSKTLSPEKWRALRHRYFRLHFQYLCAFDRPGDYDYFQITAGPRTLRERFEGRQPSRSRIDVPASPHTSVVR